MAPTPDDAFLVICFKTIEKPQISFDQVAKETGMSTGGARNKFAAIMKKLKLDDRTSDGDGDKPKPAAKAKASPKAKSKAPTRTVAKRKASVKKNKAVNPSGEEDHPEANEDNPMTNAGDNNEDDDSAEEPPAKKRKTITTTAKANNTNTTTKTISSDDHSDADVSLEEDKPAKAPAVSRKPAPTKKTTTTEDTSDTEGDKNTKTAIKGKPRGKDAKKTAELETVVDEADENADVVEKDADKNFQVTAERSTRATSARPATATGKGKSAAAKTKITKFEVVVPVKGRGGRKTTAAAVDSDLSDEEKNGDGNAEIVEESDVNSNGQSNELKE